MGGGSTRGAHVPTPRRLDVLKFPRCSNHTKGKQPGGTPKKKKRPEDGKWDSSESVPLREKPVVTLGEKRSRGRQKRRDKKWVKQATRGRRHGRERPDRTTQEGGTDDRGGRRTVSQAGAVKEAKNRACK